MKYLLTGITLCCTVLTAFSQNTFRAVISRGENKMPLAGATVVWKETNTTTISDSTGLAFLPNIPDGRQTFIFSFAGLEDKILSLNFPLDSIQSILLEESEDEPEVVVTATRTSRTISHTPTRIEVISGEELSEKGNMKPGDIRMLLSESTGIQIQQTSATSYNAGIRIQGLDGRYTQILKDGYPLYAGFAGGLSVLQIAPLDLRQVEVIKGSSSTLYGGGAIAGLVNLVSKTPGNKRELNFIANGTSALGIDISGFYSKRYKHTGLTMYAARNSTSPYDPAGIGLTAIPKSTRYTINPRWFLYGNNTTVDAGVSFITEKRIGGNTSYIKHGGSGYFESNNTQRITSTIGVRHKLDDANTIQLKNSYTRFNRDIDVPASNFGAVQQSSFTELTLIHTTPKNEWVGGVNFLTDDLSEDKSGSVARDYHYNTFGAFVQHVWSPHRAITMETGIRVDYVSQYGAELLPRLSVMYRISPAFTTRAGGGLGYKTPTIFTEQSESRQFRNILPIDISKTHNERSAGANWDLNYQATLGPVSININHMLFYTRLNRPLVLTELASGKSAFVNSTGHIDTKGSETNIRLVYKDFKLFLGYTYTDANTHYTADKSWLPLTARHRLNNILMYELPEQLKIGLEAYYFSKQRLNDGLYGKPYWITGLMVEKIWKGYSLYINFENFTDTRQTRFDTIYTGTLTEPVFRDIYAPVEGFVINGGIKLQL